ncbi:MAG: Crp/Fnr family transcriptional regulator [Desulfovibrio sp.]|jgi:CRP-like cAMP-binding protein|nr:Crp/Fnr family transcriptional regulator [Desulfovibrio sp.]
MMKFSDVNLLDELNKPENRELKDCFKQRTFDRDTQVFQASERRSRLFVVRSGRARVYLSYEDKEFTLTILGPGDIYSTHTRAAVHALTDLELLITDAEGFRRNLPLFPQMSGTIIHVLGGVLSSTFSIISGLVFKDASQRLAEFLLSEAGGPDAHVEPGTLVQPGLTVEQIAHLVGSTRQTVSTLLNDMIRSGVISRQGRGNYVIQSPRCLREYRNS